MNEFNVLLRDRYRLRMLGLMMLMEIIIALIVFASAGRMDLPWVWVSIAVHSLIMVVGVFSFDAGLVRERFKTSQNGRDDLTRPLSILMLLLSLIIAGLDAGRYGWSGAIASEMRVGVLLLYILGLSLSIWAASTNQFFAPCIRHQEERGHYVITDGPYRWIRHPGYAGLLLSASTNVVLLGSWWALLPITVIAMVFIRRTAIEDGFLKSELEGYQGYALSVRYRLVPGLW
jgi:protein-S-isoprenylcysteine O-methyltransferase Ste14